MLKQRVITALLMALPLLAILLFAPASGTVLLFALILLLGAWEWSSFVGFTKPVSKFAYIALIAVAMPLAWFWLLPNFGLIHTLSVALLWWLVALLWILFRPQMVSAPLAAIAGFFVLIPAWLCLALLELNLPHGAQWVLYLFLIVVSADIGAFLFGRKFGRHKLAPQVSPGKSWEGVAGGLLLAGVVALLGAIWFSLPMLRFITLSLITVAVSVIGDLTESMFKRHVGLKDSSTLLPGHGGVLDRIDSLTSAAPVFLCGLIHLGVYPR